MRMFEYICRCGKRFESQFQQKRHAKYMCPEKHIHREEYKTLFRLMAERPQRRKKESHEKQEQRRSTDM